MLFAALLFTSCAPAPAPVPKPKPNPTKEPWYAQSTEQLASLNRRAETLLQAGKFEEAGALVAEGQPIENRLLSAPRPTLAATEAASDLDNLYGRMLLHNRHYGWARMVFQKNVVRWKAWKPQTEDTARRLKIAEAAIAECDRRIAE